MTVALVQELDRIAERVAMLAHVVTTLRDDNQSMRGTIEQRDHENRLLRERLETARDRVETLIARMSSEA